MKTTSLKPGSTHLLSSRRFGMTLVELMFVILIMLVLATIAIPTVRFLTSDRQIREATRMLNSFVDSARNDALATGRGGVWFERSPNDPNKCTRVYKVKYPAPYEGDVAGALGFTERTDVILNSNPENSLFVKVDENSLINLQGVRPGDEIQIAGKGWWYTITEIWDRDNTISPGPPLLQYPGTSDPAYRIHFSVRYKTDVIHEMSATYKIRRQPTKRSSMWMDLPKNTFVDLGHSGLGVRDNTVTEPGHLNGGGNEFSSDASHATKTLPVVLSFKSDGQVEKIYSEYYNGAGNIETMATPPAASLFFLVAFNKQEDTAVAINNLEDPKHAWLSISRGTGKITTSRLAVTDGGTASQQRQDSREFARTAIAEGGS